jgi:hypothetical protein
LIHTYILIYIHAYIPVCKTDLGCQSRNPYVPTGTIDLLTLWNAKILIELCSYCYMVPSFSTINPTTTLSRLPMSHGKPRRFVNKGSNVTPHRFDDVRIWESPKYHEGKCAYSGKYWLYTPISCEGSNSHSLNDSFWYPDLINSNIAQYSREALATEKEQVAHLILLIKLRPQEKNFSSHQITDFGFACTVS